MKSNLPRPLPPTLWANQFRIGEGLFSSTPVLVRLSSEIDPKTFDPDAEDPEDPPFGPPMIYYSDHDAINQMLRVAVLGLEFNQQLGWATFSSLDRQDVEIWTNGALCVLRALATTMGVVDLPVKKYEPPKGQ